jgi:tRNA threonylcarbamoyl adenosine modification protein YjeE
MFSYCYQISIASLACLNKAAQQVAAVLHLGDRLGLDGALGSGKTTFCQALGLALGVESAISSPTFALLHYYQSSLGRLAHMDWYRLESEHTQHSIVLEVEELLDEAQTLLLLEWPCLAPSLFARELTLHLELRYASQTEERNLCLHSVRPLALQGWQSVSLQEHTQPFTLLQTLQARLKTEC